MNLDTSLFLAINSLPHTPFLDKLALLVHYATLGSVIYFPFFIAWLLHKDKVKRQLAKLSLTAILLTYMLNDLILKNVFQRFRPYQTLSDLAYIPPAPLSYSMPSGQAATAFAVATLWWLFFPKQKSSYFVALFAFVVAFDRIYLGHHYPSDAIVGAIVGSIIAAVVYNKRKAFR
jgi:undecaprenyl-diphosphatase